MPFFNQGELVAEMIDSILANDYQDWELLAIDDGSTQETLDILSSYEEGDSRISIVRRNREPKGAQTCRNIGLETARGEYVVFFDSDDYIAPHGLGNRVRQMELHPALDFMVFPSGTYEDHCFNPDASFAFGYPVYADDLAAFLRRTLPFIVWNNIYRTASLRRHHIEWDVKILSYQDADFNIQCLLHGLKYDYSDTLPDYGYCMGGNTGSISKKITSDAHRQSHLYYLRKQYGEVRKRFGNLYDGDLYQGALYMYSVSFSAAVEPTFARQMADVVAQFDRWRGWLMRMKVKMSLMLRTVLPEKAARQLPMMFFLVRKVWRERAVLRKIKKVKNEKS